MTNRSDIMRGSPGWKRLGDGIPQNVAPVELRVILHDLINVLQTVVPKLDETIDEHRKLSEALDEIDSRVFDSEHGIVSKLRGEFRNANRWILVAVVGGLVTIIGTLSVILLTTKGGVPG